MKKIEFINTKSDRILKCLEKECPSVVYSAFQSSLRKKDVLVNDIRIKENIYVSCGDKITVFVNENSKKNNFEIFYEDTNIIVVNKSSGIEVCDGNYNLINELKGENKEAIAVHRLDRNTSGLVIFAKTKDVENELINAFKNGKVQKFYLAEIIGNPPKNEDVVINYLLKDKEENKVQIFQNKIPNSIQIKTKYKVLKRGQNTALLEVEIENGKTHQIRAQLAYLRMPIVGDGKYGKNSDNKKYNKKYQELIAYKIKFNFENNSYLFYLNKINFELKFDYIK